MGQPTSVYVIGMRNGPCKVGISDNPGARLGALQTGCPFELVLFGHREFPSRAHARALEVAIHDFLAEHRVSGEWFDIDPYSIISGLNETADRFHRIGQNGAH